MEELVKLVSDYGFLFIFITIIVYFFIKYGDKYLQITLNRMEHKNYMIDSLTKALDNCTNVIEHNTKALENNSVVIKNYTTNAYKLENKIDSLVKELNEKDIKTTELITEIKILKNKI